MKRLVWILAGIGLAASQTARADWEAVGPYGGWIYDLEKDGSGRIYAAALFGGIYRSEDDAETWQQIYNGTEILDSRSLATNAAGHIFVGCDGRLDGTGFLRSTNGGMDWEIVGNALSTKLVRDLVVAPNQDIFASAYPNGVFRSTNNGTTFTQVLSATTSRIQVGADGTLFVGAEFETANLYRSTDNGVSWQRMDSGIDADVVDVDSFGSTWYALTSSGLYRSTDLGATWTDLQAPPEFGYNSVEITSSGDIFASLYGGLFVGGKVVRSTDGGANWTEDTGLPGQAMDRLLATAGGLFVAGSGPGVYRRDGTAFDGDGGVDWQQKVDGMTNTWIIDIAAGAPGGNLYVVTVDGRIHRSTDGGSTWGAVGDGIPIHESIRVVTVSIDGTVFAAGSFNGIYRSSDGGDSWTNVFSHPSTALACNGQGHLFSGYARDICRSTDGGDNWECFGLPDAPQYISDIAFDVASNALSTTVYAATGTPWGSGGKGVYRSVDNGDTWAAFNDGLTDLDVTCIAVSPDSSSPDCRVSIGTNGSGIFDLEGSGTWVQDATENSGDIRDMSAAPALPQMRSGDPRRGGDDDPPLRAFCRLFVLSVEERVNCGWEATEPPPVPTEIIDIFRWWAEFSLSRDGGEPGSGGQLRGGGGAATPVMFVGTNGHGLFRDGGSSPTDVDIPGMHESTALRAIEPNPFERTTTIEYEIARAGLVRLEVFDVAGRRVTTLENGWREAGIHRATWDAAGCPAGVYFSRLFAGGVASTRSVVLSP